MTPRIERAAAVAAWAAGDRPGAYAAAARGQRAAAELAASLPAVRAYRDRDAGHAARRDRARAELADALRRLAARDRRRARRLDTARRLARRLAASPWPAGIGIGAAAGAAMLPDGVAVAAFTWAAAAAMIAAVGRLGGRP